MTQRFHVLDATRILAAASLVTSASVMGATVDPLCVGVSPQDVCAATFAQYRENCTAYGFRKGSPAHAECVQREIHNAAEAARQQQATKDAAEQARGKALADAMQAQMQLDAIRLERAKDRLAASDLERARIDGAIAVDQAKAQREADQRHYEALQCALHGPGCPARQQPATVILQPTLQQPTRPYTWTNCSTDRTGQTSCLTQ